LANLHIRREHSLSLAAGTQNCAEAWAQQVEAEFGMQCSYEESAKEDRVSVYALRGQRGFARDRATISIWTPNWVFCWGPSKAVLRQKIVKNLDDLLAPKATKPVKKVCRPKNNSA
jgi:hypothetical protein